MLTLVLLTAAMIVSFGLSLFLLMLLMEIAEHAFTWLRHR